MKTCIHLQYLRFLLATENSSTLAVDTTAVIPTPTTVISSVDPPEPSAAAPAAGGQPTSLAAPAALQGAIEGQPASLAVAGQPLVHTNTVSQGELAATRESSNS